jgi:hypothetical protein
MNRETERSGAEAAGSGSVPGQWARSAKSGQDPMNRETERSGGEAAGSGSVPGQGARSAKPGHDPMMSLPPGACPGGRRRCVRVGRVGRKPQAATTPSCRARDCCWAAWFATRRWGTGWRRRSNGKGGWRVLMAIRTCSSHPSRHRAVGMAGTSPAMTLTGRAMTLTGRVMTLTGRTVRPQ